jgi:hypothetical protein
MFDPITGWLATKVGAKLAKPVLFGGMFLLVIAAVFLLGRCTGNDNEDVAAQVEQTNRSGEAIADAAEMAIDDIGEQTATEAVIDQAVEEATREIDRAESADAVRAAVIAGLCGQREHRDDPACQVQQPDTR